MSQLDSQIDRAIDYLDLEGWLSDYVDCKSAGHDEIRCEDCPKCGNSKYKVYVNTEDKLWICHRCEWKGGRSKIVHFMAEMSGRKVFDIIKELLSTVVPAVKDSEFVSSLKDALGDDDDSEEEDDSLEVASIEMPGFPLHGDIGVLATRVREYLGSRGFVDFKDQYSLRYSNKLRGHTGPYVLFPICRGHIPVAWQGRSISAGGPKYVSYDNIGNWLYPLNGDLYTNYKNKDLIILVEGIFDVLGFHKLYGLSQATLCTFGKKITSHQVDLLQRLNPDEVTLAWDPGAHREIEEAAIRLKNYFPKVSVVDLSVLPVNKNGEEGDPGDFLINDEVGKFMAEAVQNRIDSKSEEFYMWRLQKVFC